MSEEFLFESELNEISNRYVLFEEDDNTFWLYLTFPEEERPEIDCFVFNKINPIEKSEVSKYRNGPCPIVKDYSNNKSKVKNTIKDIEFVWSEDGESVALKIDGEVISFINSKTRCAYSKTVECDGPWAKKWDEGKFLEEIQG